MADKAPAGQTLIHVAIPNNMIERIDALREPLSLKRTDVVRLLLLSHFGLIDSPFKSVELPS